MRVYTADENRKGKKKAHEYICGVEVGKDHIDNSKTCNRDGKNSTSDVFFWYQASLLETKNCYGYSIGKYQNFLK